MFGGDEIKLIDKCGIENPYVVTVKESKIVEALEEVKIIVRLLFVVHFLVICFSTYFVRTLLNTEIA